MNNDFLESTSPSWLGPFLLSKKKSQLDLAYDSSMPAFLAEYTLHDSQWIGHWSEFSLNSSIAILEWDSYWSGGRIPYSASIEPTWPILLIVFSEIYHLFFSKKSRRGGSWIIKNAASAPLSLEEREQKTSSGLAQWFLEKFRSDYTQNPDVHHTNFTDVHGNALNIFHSPKIKLLCLDWEGNPITIPDI